MRIEALVGSKIGEISVADGNEIIKTVRDAIGKMESIDVTNDELHKILPKHIPRIQNNISKVPKDGGNMPKDLRPPCHRKSNVGFNDVYGRLAWDKVSSTITGGCLNPSKGRFLHPSEDRCITAREASLLQSFPRDYKFPSNIPKTTVALLIGNALPPEFCRIQAENIKNHILTND